MARDVLLRFALRNYERAREVATKVAERAERTLSTAKGLTDELRLGLAQTRELATERARAAALGKRGATAAGRDVQGLEARRFGGLFGPAAEAREKGESFVNLFTGDKQASQAIPGLLRAGAFVPGIGPFMALLAPLTEKLLGHLEERLERELARREAALVARLEEDRFRSDYTRRLAEDPAFARQQARVAFERALAEEAALGTRVEPTTADLIADFGL